MATRNVLLTNILIGAAATAIRSAAAGPATPTMTQQDAPAVIEAVKATVAANPELRQAEATLKEATEPVRWFESPVLVGSLVASVCSVLGLVYGITIPEHIQTEVIVPLIGAAGGAVVALIARWKSPVKPIGK